MKPWQVACCVVVTIVALYYLSIPVLGPHFAEVCTRGEYGPPDHCENWDILTAFVLRLFVALDEHNGVVAALAGTLVAIFTGVLWSATDKLWKVSSGQLALGRDEFLATHRPKLRVRNVVVKPASQGPGHMTLDPFHPGHPIEGQFFVSNIGDADGYVTESHCEVFWQDPNDGLPMQRPYEGKNGNNPVSRGGINSGGRVTGIFRSDELFPGLISTGGKSNVYVMGWIEYTDFRKIERRTAFCRRYVDLGGGSFRFHPIDDPDYEHEE